MPPKQSVHFERSTQKGILSAKSRVGGSGSDSGGSSDNVDLLTKIFCKLC